MNNTIENNGFKVACALHGAVVDFVGIAKTDYALFDGKYDLILEKFIEVNGLIADIADRTQSERLRQYITKGILKDMFTEEYLN